MDRLGIGLVGCGGMGMAHAQRLVQQENATLVGVCDVAPEQATKAGQSLGVPAYTSFAELLERPEVQAVLVATPNFNHREATLQAIAAGKHVFCEKPMARTAQECDEMIAAAKAKGVKLITGQVLRLMAPFARVRELVASGDFGEPRWIETSRIAWWGGRGRVTWRTSRDLMWGMLYESNVHELDFMRAVCGEAAEVQAVIDSVVHKDRETEDTALVTIRYRSGAIGLMRGSSCSTIPASDGRVCCERGTIAYDWRTCRIQYRLADQPEPTVIDLDANKLEDGYHQEQRTFIEWVLWDRPPSVTAHDGRQAIELCQAAYLSAERRAPVTLPLATSG